MLHLPSLLSSVTPSTISTFLKTKAQVKHLDAVEVDCAALKASGPAGKDSVATKWKAAHDKGLHYLHLSVHLGGDDRQLLRTEAVEVAEVPTAPVTLGDIHTTKKNANVSTSTKAVLMARECDVKLWLRKEKTNYKSDVLLAELSLSIDALDAVRDASLSLSDKAHSHSHSRASSMASVLEVPDAADSMVFLFMGFRTSVQTVAEADKKSGTECIVSERNLEASKMLSRWLNSLETTTQSTGRGQSTLFSSFSQGKLAALNDEFSQRSRSRASGDFTPESSAYPPRQERERERERRTSEPVEIDSGRGSVSDIRTRFEQGERRLEEERERERETAARREADRLRQKRLRERAEAELAETATDVDNLSSSGDDDPYHVNMSTDEGVSASRLYGI
ncbi:LOW QUALITY PROTEIN: hypothetical protein KIPB_000287 [Kipferlia bialata]|uniref:Uncharacterized protein n=1 Tax=Kipferlia bialata TaxID=797122 RepID=A0A9K3GED7_9EUKA|nr:LOW QUALITY PROTEIN: hypothetical protein KIPB_000287 [Kipferlia bialata]